MIFEIELIMFYTFPAGLDQIELVLTGRKNIAH